MKKICIVSGSRAEYGLLKSLISKVNKSKKTSLQLIVTGSHLSIEYGSTFKEIKKDGFRINDKIYVNFKKKNSKFDVPVITGKLIIDFIKILKKRKPDFLILIGDRYEMFAAAYAAMSVNVKIIHIHGGEKTIGSLDDTIRHCITKMSTWHFVSTKTYRSRVIQLGENPKKVFLCGALAYENIKNQTLYSKEDFQKKINMKLNKNNFIITFHPETTKKNINLKAFDNILKALKKTKKSSFIFTMPNADADSFKIKRKILNFVKKNKNNSSYFLSMGQKLYYSALKHCNIVLGNSSSGIIEAPYFKIPTVNVGFRQKGRVYSKSVINSNSDLNSINYAIKKAININKKANVKFYNPYGETMASEKIFNFINKTKVKNNDFEKDFFDIKLNLK